MKDCLRHVSSDQVFIVRKTCTCSFMVFISWSVSTRLLIRMHERNSIKLHVQVFLRMDTWLFETYRRHNNWIRSLTKKVCIELVLITYVYHNRRFKTRNFSRSVIRQIPQHITGTTSVFCDKVLRPYWFNDSWEGWQQVPSKRLEPLIQRYSITPRTPKSSIPALWEVQNSVHAECKARDTEP